MASRDSRGRFQKSGTRSGTHWFVWEMDSAAVDARLDSLKERAANFSPVMEPLAERLATALKENIDTVTSPSLTEAYAKRKAKKYPGKPLLRASDALYGSFRPRHTDVEAFAGPEGIPYAAAQNFGYEPRNLPGRSFVYISPAVRVFAEDLVARYLTGGEAVRA